jgi:hypothetical protein
LPTALLRARKKDLVGRKEIEKAAAFQTPWENFSFFVKVTQEMEMGRAE